MTTDIYTVRNLNISPYLSQLYTCLLNYFQESKQDGLVVCCSLLDKANNLGGITRTAEIFGATELIFDNLNVLSDKNYTALAVTGSCFKKII